MWKHERTLSRDIRRSSIVPWSKICGLRKRGEEAALGQLQSSCRPPPFHRSLFPRKKSTKKKKKLPLFLKYRSKEARQPDRQLVLGEDERMPISDPFVRNRKKQQTCPEISITPICFRKIILTNKCPPYHVSHICRG